MQGRKWSVAWTDQSCAVGFGWLPWGDIELFTLTDESFGIETFVLVDLYVICFLSLPFNVWLLASCSSSLSSDRLCIVSIPSWKWKGNVRFKLLFLCFCHFFLMCYHWQLKNYFQAMKSLHSFTIHELLESLGQPCHCLASLVVSFWLKLFTYESCYQYAYASLLSQVTTITRRNDLLEQLHLQLACYHNSYTSKWSLRTDIFIVEICNQLIITIVTCRNDFSQNECLCCRNLQLACYHYSYISKWMFLL